MEKRIKKVKILLVIIGIVFLASIFNVIENKNAIVWVPLIPLGALTLSTLMYRKMIKEYKKNKESQIQNKKGGL